jgi:heat shock protein HslJ/uncharacterized membrane protein
MKFFTLVIPFFLCFCQGRESNRHEFEVNTSNQEEAHQTAGVSAGIVYFKAKGTSPEWELNISEDKIAFSSSLPDFSSFNAPHVEAVKAADMNVKKYSVETEAGQMDIQIIQGSCQVADSREGFSYKAEVRIRRGIDSTFTSFEGCGVYVTDPRLNGKWQLYSMKGTEVTSQEYTTRLPELEIKSNGNSFSGFAGCNTISGRIFFERNLLRFTDVVATKMACDAMQYETAFLQALRFSTQYKFEDDRLILSYPDHTTLVFKPKQ